MKNTVFVCSVPSEVLEQLHFISDTFDSDFETDMLNLFKCYIESFKKLYPVQEVVSIKE